MNEQQKNGPQRPAFTEDVIDLRAYFKVLHKWRKVIALGTFLAVLTSGILSFFILQPVYEAKTLLMVTQAADRQRVVEQDGLEGVVGTLSRIPVMTMNTYLGQIKSEALMDRVIAKLGLDRALYEPRHLLEMVDASVIKDANLIEVRVRHTDPVLARDIANAINTEYLLMLSDKNEEQMARSVDFLERQRDEALARLDEAQGKLKEFEAQPRSVAVLEAEFTQKSEDLARYKSRLNTAVIELQQISAGVARMQEELNATPQTISVERSTDEGVVTAREPNPVYATLSERLSERKAAQAEKEAEVQALTQLIAGLEGETSVLLAELTTKRAGLDRLRDEVNRLDATANLLAQKVTETQIARSIDLGQTSVVVVSPANTPTTPVKPNKKLNMAVALVLGLMVFVGLAFVLEHLDYTIKNPEDVERHLELPVLGVVPAVDARAAQRSTY
ncbi:GumC family protein [Candidatus Desulforudis audaxviator]|uniref:Lipopolysaccharide biosynthesis n=1 Tax=Desulforudis audaxviator (strain MP104C) TaxID=477974 RepID=B1I5B3_DESAP|nr:Wzz/FepE/Etk N-terminal domain-containing protein [Candidatus Desulforudis audaxviator]ACA60164.1 lipopolysaccharide biosynthesis [Candidatus Desulforudis audaxviator MP104C]AZK60203.1 lipopolysaccharide biosynthesis protein [Candidatus Desulforudis audaxviator]